MKAARPAYGRRFHSSCYGETLMTKISSTLRRPVAIATMSSRAPRIALLMLAGLTWTSAARAVQYDFLSVSGNNLPGNAASTTFTSDLTPSNGVITVTHVFSSAAAVGAADNNNALIFPSKFEATFPGTGQVQGHLAQTVYGDPNDPRPGGGVHTSQVIFNLTGYTGYLPDLIFGMWNTTDEIPLPAYDIKLFDGTNIVPPTTFNTYGNQDNELQVQADHFMQLDPTTGNITAPLPTSINPNGVHTTAIFFNGIPVGTQQIIVTGNLTPLNNIGDGVGYYFAEIVPEPASVVLLSIAVAATLLRRRR
jgi:hypothetical protein